MAIYHLSVKPICRAAGRSATAAAAYRSATEIFDLRTGVVYDYRRKRGVVSTFLVLPSDCSFSVDERENLWQAAELAEKRKDACVAREVEVALPSELSQREREQLVCDFVKAMVEDEGCAVDVAIHEPSSAGDDRNFHAHLLRTTRKVGRGGFGEKVDTEKAGRRRTDDLKQLRERWSVHCNNALAKAKCSEKVDHRSLKDQCITRKPGVHFGVDAINFERRTNIKSEKRQIFERQAEIAALLQKAKADGEKLRRYDRHIIVLKEDIEDQIKEMDQLKSEISFLDLEEKKLILILDEKTENLVFPCSADVDVSRRFKF